MPALSGPDVAEWADLSIDQLDYFRRLGILQTDVGNTRKRWSLAEARLAVITASAVKFGIDPKTLADPIAWLRQHVAWPSVDLPDNPVDVAIELSADALRDKDFSIEKRVEVLAAQILGIPRADLEGIEQRRAEAALARAHELLKQPKKWVIETRRQVERALDFELACRGSADLFFHISTRDESWSTFLSKDVAKVENEAVWLVIDIRRLFSQRRPMF